MKFEVFKDGKRVFWTEDEKCVPDEETIKSLKKNSYKVKVKENDKGS